MLLKLRVAFFVVGARHWRGPSAFFVAGATLSACCCAFFSPNALARMHQVSAMCTNRGRRSIFGRCTLRGRCNEIQTFLYLDSRFAVGGVRTHCLETWFFLAKNQWHGCKRQFHFFFVLRLVNRIKMCSRRPAFCLLFFAFRSGRRARKCSKSFCFHGSMVPLCSLRAL